MFTARYSTALQPAAPIIRIPFRNPGGGVPELLAEAQLDTGADRTVFPTDMVTSLRLVKQSEKDFGVVNGVVKLKTYLLGFTIPGVGDFVVEAAASASEDFVLIGRDVLNCIHTVLDGPARQLELSSAQPPATP